MVSLVKGDGSAAEMEPANVGLKHRAEEGEELDKKVQSRWNCGIGLISL